MTPTEFELLVREALAVTVTAEATRVAEAALAGDLDTYDFVALVASWVTAALDPDGTEPPVSLGPGWPTAGFPVFRLPGLEAAARRELDR